MPGARKYPEELIERGVRLALESGRPVAAVARDLGVGWKVSPSVRIPAGATHTLADIDGEGVI